MSSPVARLLKPLTGPAIWFGHFMVLYAAETLACRAPATAGSVMGLIGAVTTLLALGALALLAFRLNRRRSREFLDYAASALVVLSALGVIWAALPIVMLEPCATP